MKVALLAFDFEEYTASLAHGLSVKEEVDLYLYMPRDLMERVADGLDPNTHLRPFPSARLRQPLAQLRNCRTLLNSFDADEIDLVHIQHGHLWFNGFLTRLKVPFVITAHDAVHHPGDGSQRTPQWLLYSGFRRASHLIVHAKQVQDHLAKLGFRSGEISVLPHPALLDAEAGSPDLDSPPGSSSNQIPTVLFFGRIWPYKGLDFLIKAAPLISQEIPDVRFVIAGQGEDPRRYIRMIEDPERFELINRYIPNDERSRLFKDCSLVVLPYVEASQSGVIPIAYAHGRAVVASRVGGLPELVEHRSTGLLVPARDHVALAQAVIKLLQDNDYRERLGQQGRRKLERDLNPESIGELTLNVYRSACGT